MMGPGQVGGVVGALLVMSGVLACGPASGPPGVGGGAGGRTAPTVAPAGASSELAGAGVGSTGVSPAQLAAPVGPPRQFEMPLVSTAATMVPLWVAAEHGLFQRHGLDPQLVPMPPATAAQALSAGSALIAAAGGSVVSAWVGGATDLVFVAGISSKAPYRVVVKPDILRMDDLRGKSIGVSTPGSSPTVAMVEVLRRYGMTSDDVNLTYLRDSSATVAAFTTGVVQGVATSSPQVELAMAEGGRLLLDMRELNVPILGPQIATTRGLVEREPEFIRRVLMAYVEGLQLARDRPDEAIPALMRGARLDDRELAEVAFGEYYDVWDPWLHEAAIQTLLDNMDVPAARTTRPADMQDDRFLRELERSGWLAQHLRAR